MGNYIGRNRRTSHINCRSQARNKAIHTLEGLISGIAIDGHINVAEVAELEN